MARLSCPLTSAGSDGCGSREPGCWDLQLALGVYRGLRNRLGQAGGGTLGGQGRRQTEGVRDEADALWARPYGAHGWHLRESCKCAALKHALGDPGGPAPSEEEA